MFLSLFIMAVGIAYIIYVSLSLSPTELQVATRYTAFGGTQYYRNKWFYLIGFIVFGLLITVLHIGTMLKLEARGMRPLAVSFGWLSILLMVILFLITFSVLGVAYLS